MPIIKSAQKRMRQEKKRRAYNTATKTGVKKQFRAVRDELAAGKPKDNTALIAAIAEIDKAVKRGVIHKRTAARKNLVLPRRIILQPPNHLVPKTLANQVVKPKNLQQRNLLLRRLQPKRLLLKNQQQRNNIKNRPFVGRFLLHATFYQVLLTVLLELHSSCSAQSLLSYLHL